MIRKHESTVSLPAALLSIAIHGVLAVALLFSVNWKISTKTPQVMQAELWKELPKPPIVSPPQPVVIPSEPVVEPPEPPKLEELPEPVAPPQLALNQPDDIALKQAKKQEQIKQQKIAQLKLKQEQQRKQAEQLKIKQAQEKAKQEKLAQEKAKQEKLEQLKKETQAQTAAKQATAAEDAKKKALIAKIRQEELENAKRAIKLKELQTEIAGESTTANASVNHAELNAYTEKLKAKIRGNVNQSLCPNTDAELKFDLRLLPTGQIAGKPKLAASSGNGVCDDAVTRAILASEPFELPSDPHTRDKMLNLRLKFRPHH